MKSKSVLRIIFTAVVFLLSAHTHSQVTLTHGGGMIDLSECHLKVGHMVEVDELPAPGGSIKPSTGSRKLLKVQLTGTTPREGSVIIKPFTFTAMYSYRRLTYLIQSRAVGVIRKDRATGTLVEMWHTDPDNIFHMGFGANSEVTFDIAFEIPKEVQQIEIQAPMIVKKK